MEFIVATIFRAMIPDFPTPVMMTRPLHAARRSTARPNSSPIFASRALTASRSMRTTSFPLAIAVSVSFIMSLPVISGASRGMCVRHVSVAR